MTTVGETPRRGRRAARTAEELRHDMVEVGLQLLSERGLDVGLDTIRFDEVVRVADAPRASAYRAWSDADSEEGPQVRFHDALAAEVLRNQPGFADSTVEGEDGALAATLAAVAEVLAELPDVDALSSEERGFWLRQIHRVGSNANQQTMDDSRLWQCYIAIAAGLMSQRDIPDELLEAWQVGEQRLIDRYRDLYSTMAAMFGFRLRYCYTWEQFDTAAGALAEGLCIRSTINPHVRNIERFTGPGGAEQEWSLFAVCFEGLLHQFFEPVPGVTETDLSHEPGS